MRKEILLEDKYHLKEIIGEGSFGKVYKTFKNGSNIPLATKRIKKEKVENPDYIKYFINEVTILQNIDHKNIIKVESLKKTNNYYYIIMEFCNGGTLRKNFEKYKEKYENPFTEKMNQHIMRQLIKTIYFLHSQNIVHRDLKLENILLNYNTEEDKNNLDILNSELKVIDFGTAIHKSNAQLLQSVIGSPWTMDPLILKMYLNCSNSILPYDEKIDIWSLGIISYYLFTGELPFKASNLFDLMNEIEEGEIKIPLSLSAEAISFLIKIFQYSPQKRINAKELKEHSFIEKDFKNFSYLNNKDVSKFVKNGYLCINIKNSDEINSIVDQYISKNTLSTNNTNSLQDSLFTNSYYNSQINEIINNIIDIPEIKGQDLLHQSLIEINQNNNINNLANSSPIVPTLSKYPNFETSNQISYNMNNIQRGKSSNIDNNIDEEVHNSLLPKQDDSNNNNYKDNETELNMSYKSFNQIGSGEIFFGDNIVYNSYQPNYYGNLKNNVLNNNSNK